MANSNGFLSKILGWLPGWLGFVLIILAGISGILVGTLATPSPGLVAFGVAAIASSILAWSTGATSTPRANPFKRSFGGVVENLKPWVWLVVFVLFLIAVLIAVFT